MCGQSICCFILGSGKYCGSLYDEFDSADYHHIHKVQGIYEIMKLAVRFRFYKAVTPSMHIVEMTAEQWREFLLFEDAQKRLKYMKRFLNMTMDLDIKEMWWIPLNEQKALTISKKANIARRESMEETREDVLREAIMAAQETQITMEEHRKWLEEHSRIAEQRLEKLKAEYRELGYDIDNEFNNIKR